MVTPELWATEPPLPPQEGSISGSGAAGAAVVRKELPTVPGMGGTLAVALVVGWHHAVAAWALGGG